MVTVSRACKFVVVPVKHIKVHMVRGAERGGKEMQLLPFLTSALDGSERLHSCPLLPLWHRKITLVPSKYKTGWTRENVESLKNSIYVFPLILEFELSTAVLFRIQVFWDLTLFPGVRVFRLFEDISASTKPETKRQNPIYPWPRTMITRQHQRNETVFTVT